MRSKSHNYFLTQNGIAIPVHFKFFRGCNQTLFGTLVTKPVMFSFYFLISGENEYKAIDKQDTKYICEILSDKYTFPTY